jgi:hypothetical protein
MRIKILFMGLLLAGLSGGAQAQDSSLLHMLSDSMSTHSKPTPVHGTFKAIYLVNLQSSETIAAGALNFEIQHRFGQLNSGAYNFFGLDNATLRLGLDYGITDRLTVGIGRSSYLKTFDGFLKYKLLMQTEGEGRTFPVSVTLLGDISNYTQDMPDQPYLDANYRTSYVAQVIIARKFKAFSLEVVPSYIRANLVPTVMDKNDMFAVSGAARVKLTRRMSIDGEYNYLLPNEVVSTTVHNSMSLAYEIETGGHVFQLVFSNSQSMIPNQFLAQTAGRWQDGAIYFGFNIARNFNISSHAKKISTQY